MWITLNEFLRFLSALQFTVEKSEFKTSFATSLTDSVFVVQLQTWHRSLNGHKTLEN